MVLTPLKCGRRLNIKEIILKTKKGLKFFMSLFDNEKAKGQWEEEVVGEGKAMATKENGLFELDSKFEKFQGSIK
jgi:hypothetical protein